MIISFALYGNSNSLKYPVDLCAVESISALDFFLPGNITYDGTTLAVNSAQIFDFGTNNFSDNHYEYFLTLSDGIYNGGNEYIGGTYSITIELLSLGDSFNYGNFQSCFFCGNTTNYSYVGHLFLIEDTNDDDQLDFNTDPFSDGSTGMVTLNKTGDITSLEIDFVMDDDKILKGCHNGTFLIDPTLSTNDFSKQIKPSIKIHNNPVKDILKFEVKSQIKEPYNYKIYNRTGKLLIKGSSKDSYSEIDMSHMPRGVFLLSISIKNNDVIVKKIILQ